MSKKPAHNLYLTKYENIRYHTGFMGSYGVALLTTSGQIYLFTDGRYTEQAKKLCYKNVKIVIIKDDLHEEIEKILKKHRITELGFEANNLTYNQALKLRRQFKGTKLIPLEKEIDQLRMVKTKKEINLIQTSQKVNERVLCEIIKILKPGINEAEIAWQIYKIGRDIGVDGTSFDPIVAFGKNSASPHYMPDCRVKLKKGDPILIDMGMQYRGYCSDMTRCFFTKAPSSQQAEVYNTVLAAQENAIANIQPDQPGHHGDNFSRSVITDAGYGEYFTHANGHGVGLEIHESPSLSSKLKHKDRRIKFQENMVVTVEPGIYLPGKFGIRIEDMIVVKKGKNKNLTNFPKQLEDIIIKL